MFSKNQKKIYASYRDSTIERAASAALSSEITLNKGS